MKILEDLNKKYNFRQYFESEDVKINKDILSEMSNREISKDYTNLDLIKKSDLYNDENQKTNFYNDLEFFIDYKNGNKTIFNKIDRTHTNGGSTFLKQLLLNPSSNIDYLNSKKNSLEEIFNLIKNKQETVLTKLDNLKKYEESIFWILNENSIETESLINLLYFNGYLIKNLNNSSHILTATNLYKIFVSPVIGLVSPILYILTPFVMLRYKLKVKISFINYAKLIYNYYMNMNFGNLLGNSKLDFIRKLWMLFSLLFYCNGIFNSIELAKLSYKLNNLICTQVYGVIQYILNGYSLIEEIYNEEHYKNIFNKIINKDTILSNSYLKQFKNLDTPNIYLSNFGEKLNLYKFIKKDTIKDLLNTTYLCDTIVSLYLIKNYNGLIYSTFSNSKEPVVNITGLKHPNIENFVKNDILIDNNNNLIITGPNAGGKSTFIKSIAINILLSQTLCFSYCDSIELTPFYYLSSQMNIVDDKGYESLFEAEMNRIVTNVNNIDKCNKDNKLSILFLDELFNSTNIVEGICGSYSICKKLSNLSTNITLLTTHFTYLYKLEKTTKRFVNYKMNAIVEKDSIKFPYKLHKGFSKQFVALELLKNNKLLENNKELFEEAIKFKKELLSNEIKKDKKNKKKLCLKDI